MTTDAVSSSGSAFRRRPASAGAAHNRPIDRPAIHPDIDPPPTPRRSLQLLALALLVFFASLQFLPPTHFRDPNDPFRTWIPFDSNRTSAYSRGMGKESNAIQKLDLEVEMMHMYSWINCLDLRVLAVLANSTLSSSRFPERIYLHFIIPEGEDTKLSYHKLKVVLPHANLEVIGQREIKEKLRMKFPEDKLFWQSLHLVAPLIIPIIIPSLSRFLYVSPETIVKGDIKDLFMIDLGPYSIGAAENCSMRLGDYINMDIVNAIQRTSARSWVSEEPYDKSSCLPDMNFLFIDANRLDKNLVEAISWWIRVLNLENARSSQLKPVILLAFYNKIFKLSSSWKPCNSAPSIASNETNVLWFDGPRRSCSAHENEYQGSEFGNNWQQYFHQKSDAILNN